MYNKIFTKILDSSIWLESDATRIVWLTMLASMDQDGFCQFASVANLAHRAVVSKDSAAAAVKTLEAVDPNSSDPEHEGRRIDRVDGGWMVLNASKYRDIVTAEESRRKNRERVQRFRKKRGGNADVIKGNDLVMQSEAYAVSDTEALKTIAPSAPVKTPKFSLPEWIEKTLWEDYEKMRRSIGKPMTDPARNLAVDKLAKLLKEGHAPPEVLKQSIFNSWQGLFAIKGETNAQHQGNSGTSRNGQRPQGQSGSKTGPGAYHSGDSSRFKRPPDIVVS